MYGLAVNWAHAATQSLMRHVEALAFVTYRSKLVWVFALAVQTHQQYRGSSKWFHHKRAVKSDGGNPSFPKTWVPAMAIFDAMRLSSLSSGSGFSTGSPEPWDLRVEAGIPLEAGR